MHWRPIKTAPEDQMVLVWNGTHVLPANNRYGAGWQDLSLWDYEGYGLVEPVPTHWMPFPEGPNLTKGDG